jgi:hypothetical protein
MVEKFFLALDYNKSIKADERAHALTASLRMSFGPRFVAENLGFKFNQDMIVPQMPYNWSSDRRKNIFADMKLSCDPDCGRWEINKLKKALPSLSYITISATLGETLLKNM